jgi:hypothetical protein
MPVSTSSRDVGAKVVQAKGLIHNFPGPTRPIHLHSVSRRRRHIGITVYGITGFSICLITTSFIRVARCGFKRLLCVKLRVCCAFAGEAKSHWSEPVVIELNKQITNVFLDTLYRIRYILRRSRCWNPESPNRSSHHSGLKLLQCKNVSCSAFLIRHYHTRINDAFLFLLYSIKLLHGTSHHS